MYATLILIRITQGYVAFIFGRQLFGRLVKESFVPASVVPVSILAVMLIAAIIGGYLARWIHIPRIIGYIVAGIILRQAFDFFGTPVTSLIASLHHLVTDITIRDNPFYNRADF